MPSIEIADLTNSRLQAIAIPLTDTHDSVIARLLDHYATTTDAVTATSPKIVSPGEPIRTLDSGLMIFDPASPPPLAFTTCTQIIISGDQLSKNDCYWNTMMFQMLRAIKKQKNFDPETIKAMLCVANSEVGVKDDNGYKFLPEVGLSVQGQDSNAAFRQAYQLAVLNGIKFKVFFKWQINGKAAFPNQNGYMEF